MHMQNGSLNFTTAFNHFTIQFAKFQPHIILWVADHLLELFVIARTCSGTTKLEGFLINEDTPQWYHKIHFGQHAKIAPFRCHFLTIAASQLCAWGHLRLQVVCP